MAQRRRPADLVDHKMEHVAARELQRVFVWLPPWIGLVAVLGAGLLLRHVWPGPAGGAGVAAGALVLAALDLYLTHHRAGLARYFAAATSVLAGAWLAWVTWAGLPLHSDRFRVWLVGGGILAACWSHWLHIHENGDETGTSRQFAKAAAKAGFPRLRLIKARTVDGHVTGQIVHDDGGMTHEELAKAIPAIEASWPGGIPPGSLLPTRNRDHAGRTDTVIADPRVLDEPVPWIGPYRPRKSIALPLRLGKWQDGSDVLVTVTNWHEQIMAMTGAGKTLGACYAELGETITRFDAGVWVIDLGKGEQFLGCMRPALHYLATTRDQAKWLLTKVEACLTPRMDYLGSKGLGNWEEGCGLRHMTLWIEEAADLFEAIGAGTIEDYLFPLLRRARSAGVRVVYSLHRASYDQMPTFLRDMVSLCTMGVKNDAHARFGLSPAQVEADCSPELWGDNPEDRGKFFLDCPAFAKKYRTMAGRFWFWAKGPKDMAAHAAQFPVTERPYDLVTAPFFAEEKAASPAAGAAADRPDAPEEDAAMEMFPDDLMMPGPDEDAWDAVSGDPLDDDDLDAEGDIPLGAALPQAGPEVPVSAEVAIDTVRQQIAQWRVTGVPQPRGHGGPTRRFTVPDLRNVRDRLGRSRSWLYVVLPKLEEDREIARDGDGWIILDKAA